MGYAQHFYPPNPVPRSMSETLSLACCSRSCPGWLLFPYLWGPEAKRPKEGPEQTRGPHKQNLCLALRSFIIKGPKRFLQWRIQGCSGSSHDPRCLQLWELFVPPISPHPLAALTRP